MSCEKRVVTHLYGRNKVVHNYKYCILVLMCFELKIKGWIVDDKFRNVTGLSMQLATIHYIVTGGKEGLKNSSKIFREVYDLYKEDPEKFDRMVKGFYLKYE